MACYEGEELRKDDNQEYIESFLFVMIWFNHGDFNFMLVSQRSYNSNMIS